MKHIIFRSILLATLFIGLNVGCKSTKIPAQDSDIVLDHVWQMMSGSFNSGEQAMSDSSYFDISLTMLPIWEGKDQDARWLYVEQAVTATKRQPYRQRVYRLTIHEGTIESKVYELKNPGTYIHGWENPSIFDQLIFSSLSERAGCSVFLSMDGNCYEGSTKEQECLSNLRGATHATSIVKVCEEEIVSWDQGWNQQGEQVWGAIKGGYIFRKDNTK